MPRSLYLIFIIFSLFLTGLITLRGEILTLAIPFVVYLLSGFIRDPGELQIEVTRQLSADRVPPGTPVEITLTITNRGYDIEELFLEDILPPALGIRDGSPRSLVTLSRGQTHTMKYVVEGPRGGYTFETLRAKADDHLAVTSREVRLGAKGHFFVFPPIIRLRYVAIRQLRSPTPFLHRVIVWVCCCTAIIWIGRCPVMARCSASAFCMHWQMHKWARAWYLLR
jgi:uncharacterized protein (DUF58 family)